MRARFAVLAALLGCSGDECLERIASCPDCGPGEIRYGFISDAYAYLSIDAFPDGTLVTEVCDRVAVRGRDLGELVSTELAVPDEHRQEVTVAAGGDAFYVLTNDSGPPSDQQPPSDGWRWGLRAFGVDGTERWYRSLGATNPLMNERFGITAGPEGPYLLAASGAVTALDPAGATRWTAPAPNRMAGESELYLVPDGMGGAVTAVDAWSRDPIPVTATVRGVDAGGAERWRRTWSATRHLAVTHMAAGRAGELAVVGSFTGTTLDLGDVSVLRPMADEPNPATFVAMLEPDGTTRWAFAFEDAPNGRSRSVVSLGDRIVLAGEYDGAVEWLGLPASDDSDVFLAVISRDGVERVHVFGGYEQQYARAIERAADGTVAMVLSNQNRGTITIGSRSFTPGHSHELLVTLEP